MPSFNDARTADSYQAAGPGLPTIENILPLPNGGGRFNVEAGGGAVLCQVQYGAQGAVEWAENEEQLLNPGAYGTIPDNAAGIRFRSAKPGVPGIVSASMGTDPTRPALSIDALGAISTVTTSNPLVYNVHDYGALGDGATDDTNAIQLAINAAAAAGGGIVFFPIPAVNYLVNGTLNLTDLANIRLVGAAAADEPYDGPTGVVLVRGFGSAPMLVWQATALSGRSLRGCGIENIGFQCNTLCPGLIIKDIWGGFFKNILVYAPQDGAVGLDIGTTGIGTVGTQGCLFYGVSVTTAGSATCVRLSSAAAGGTNVSGNVFLNCLIDHHSGVGLDMGDADSNTFIQLGLNRPSGTGDGILLRGSNTLGQGFARANVFYNLSCVGPVRSQATALVQPALNNTVQINPESGAGGPIVEPGSTLTWTTTRAFYGLDLSQSVNGLGAVLLADALAWAAAGGAQDVAVERQVSTPTGTGKFLELTEGDGLGYGTGTGGIATIANNGAGTINKPTGKVTASAGVVNGANYAATVNDSCIGPDDTVIVNCTNAGAGASGSTLAVTAVAAGSFSFYWLNNSGGAITPVFTFAVIKGAVA